MGRRVYWLRTLIALILLLSAATVQRADADGPSAAAPADVAHFVVYCYDRARDNVSRVLSSDCHGEVVSEAFAKAVEQRHDDAIARALRAQAQNGHEGMHLARIGTAFYVDEQARLLTDNHVVEGCKAMSLLEEGGKQLPASVLAVDQVADLALLGVSVPRHAVAYFRSDAAAVDPTISIVGYPDLGLPPIDPVIAQGTLLRTDVRALRGGSIIFHADVRHGNSGGPIFDSRGAVIGVVRAKIDTVRTFAASGRDIENIGTGADLPVILDFLRRNNVAYRVTTGTGVLTDRQILAAATKFVARAQCWQ
jgi:serine protease Do